MATKTRAKGYDSQRNKGWILYFEESFPELKKRLNAKSNVGVFVRSRALQYPGENVGSLRVRKIVRKDFDEYYAGGQWPNYVFDTFIGEIPEQITQIAAE